MDTKYKITSTKYWLLVMSYQQVSDMMYQISRIKYQVSDIKYLILLFPGLQEKIEIWPETWWYSSVCARQFTPWGDKSPHHKVRDSTN